MNAEVMDMRPEPVGSYTSDIGRQIAAAKRLTFMATGAGALRRTRTALWCAVAKGHVHIVEKLLAHQGIDVNISRTPRLSSPLRVAVNGCFADIVRMLLAVLHITVREGTLSAAVNKGRADIVSMLLTHGADVNESCTCDQPCGLHAVGAIPLCAASRSAYLQREPLEKARIMDMLLSHPDADLNRAAACARGSVAEAVQSEVLT